ncbi:hypothetical protein QBC32DRAFT_396583 [Pseudoneurospora amorphoporcata]|uniref:Methylthioribose-1-phosphate isomerase n=1 Tax=Pseudoneurospora amorphoporcata TaxID=241081 RepID=A0AAN6NY51_9PEZI|nr:hypothetical protein QBC32DRAFT_396583 [Pseudoneurospora amorphoporcata]
MSALEAIKYTRGKLEVLDQLRLPHEHHYDEVSTSEEAFDCIKAMRVRGAPAIAIVAALAASVELHNGSCTATGTEHVIKYIDGRLDYLYESRPTAVDLGNAVKLLKRTVRDVKTEGLTDAEAKKAIIKAFIEASEEILAKDLKTNKSIGAFGAKWLQEQYKITDDSKITVITHCNTGSLATSGHGTALGIIRTLRDEGLLRHAYCTETRPYNQGSRLTAFELVHEGIPSTLITDSMAAALFRLRKAEENIAAVIVGADRVVRNGDTANKIGTYQLAVLAKHHGIKFMVAAPTTSIDVDTLTGDEIEIEQRKREELTQISGAVVNVDGSIDTSKSVRVAIADQRIGVWNPGFDVTPHEYIDAIVTEKGTAVKGEDGKFHFEDLMPERFTTCNLLLLWGTTLLSPSSAFVIDNNHHQHPLIGDASSSSSSISPLQISTSSATANKQDAPSYRKNLLSLHKSLIEIPSISRTEQEVGKFLLDYLRNNLGYVVKAQFLESSDSSQNDDNDHSQGRFNVLAWPSSHNLSSPRVLVTSHIDVVPPFIPYHISTPESDQVRSDTFISGRGSVDAKASVAAQMVAVEELIRAKEVDPADLMLLFVVGEEISGDGMKAFSTAYNDADKEKSNKELELPHFKAAIYGEPTENKLSCGHKGHTGGMLKAQGIAGHSGYPWLFKSATEILVKALAKIIDADLGSSDRYGNTTVNMGTISGGVAANVIPKEAQAKLAIRVAAGNQSTGADIVWEAVDKILKEVDQEAFTMEWTGGYGPVECYCDVDGFETMVASYGTDVPNFEGDHVSYLYGPGSILVAHGDDEGLKVGDLETAVEGYKTLIKHALAA